MLIEDRPREKMLKKGAHSLSNVELLAVLLRTGGKGKSVLELAKELAETPEKLSQLAAMKPNQLSLYKGIGPAKAVTIAAAFELGKRLAYAAPAVRQVISNTKDAVNILMPQMRYEDKESFLLVMLNAKGHILHTERLFQGSLTSSVVHPREVFHTAIIHRAAAIIAAHNHPSGDPEPSNEDIEFTRTLVMAGNLMGIPVLDHIIIGDGNYFSFDEQGFV